MLKSPKAGEKKTHVFEKGSIDTGDQRDRRGAALLLIDRSPIARKSGPLRTIDRSSRMSLRPGAGPFDLNF